MDSQTQTVLIIFGVVLIVLIVWNKYTSKEINKYNAEREKNFKKAYEKLVPQLKAAGLSDIQIQKRYEKMKYDMEHQEETEVQKNIKSIMRDPVSGINSIADKHSKEMESLNDYYKK